MEFNCKKCGTKISPEHRVHYCKGTRSLHGQMVSTLTVYNPSVSRKSSKQSVPSYMKRFGSRSK